MRAAGRHPLGKQPARDPLPRFRLADQPPTARHPPHHRRPHRSLQIQYRVVFPGPQRLPQSFDFMKSFLAQRRFSPLPGGRKENPVH
jgi:hypothetical protein